jgi:hypothetical protein
MKVARPWYVSCDCINARQTFHLVLTLVHKFQRNFVSRGRLFWKAVYREVLPIVRTISK